MYFALTILLLLGAFIVLFVSTAFLEKQHIRDFVPAPPETSTGDSPYSIAMNEAARRLGFTPAGVYVQNRSSRVYQARVALWVSPDCQTLLRIGSGKTAGVPIKRSSLTSFVEPDCIVEVSDDFGMADLSGLTDRTVVLNAHLDELLARHKERLGDYPGPKRVFSAIDALAACETMQAMRAVQMEKLGLGKFLDGERTVWRHTLKGAWLSYFKGFRAQLAEGKAQRDRIALKRPGQK